jgi:hypothetical protein
MSPGRTRRGLRNPPGSPVLCARVGTKIPHAHEKGQRPNRRIAPVLWRGHLRVLDRGQVLKEAGAPTQRECEDPGPARTSGNSHDYGATALSICDTPIQVALLSLHLTQEQLSPANRTPSLPAFPESVTLAYCSTSYRCRSGYSARSLGTSRDGDDLASDERPYPERSDIEICLEPYFSGL